MNDIRVMVSVSVSAWCTMSDKTDLMIYLNHHWKFGIHLKRCIFTMFVHAFFVYAYYLSIYISVSYSR